MKRVSDWQAATSRSTGINPFQWSAGHWWYLLDLGGPAAVSAEASSRVYCY